MCELNFERQIAKARKVLFLWKNRSLTLKGKITILKSQIIPLFTHLFSTLPDPSKDTFKRLNTLFFKFIWSGGRDQIKRNMLTNDYSEGGLKMTDILAFCKYMKIKWVKRLLSSTGLWQSLAKATVYPYDNINVFNFQNQKLRKTAKIISNPFWKDVLLSICIIREDNILTREQFFSLSSLNFIPLKEFPEFLGWYNNGLQTMQNLFTSSGNLKPFEHIKHEFALHGTFLLYFKLIKSIPPFWINAVKEQMNVDKSIDLHVRLINNEDCKFVYNLFQEKRSANLNHLRAKWEAKLEVPLTKEAISQCFELIHKTTIDSKTRNFQYKLIHRIITTNSFLQKIGKREDNLCTFCETESETIEHIFFNCTKVQSLLRQLEDWYKTSTSNEIDLDRMSFLLGNQNHSGIVNHLYSITKQYIYRCKCGLLDLQFPHLLNTIIYTFKIEKYINNNSQSFKDKWAVLSQEMSR